MTAIRPDVPSRSSKQLLHLVFGGELKSLTDVEFANHRRAATVVGIYPELRGSLQSLEGGGPAHGRQRPHALLHRAHPPPARPEQGAAAALVTLWHGRRPHFACCVSGMAAPDLIGRRGAIAARDRFGQPLEIRPSRRARSTSARAARCAASSTTGSGRAGAQIAAGAALHRGPGRHHRRLPAHHQALLRLADEGRQPACCRGCSSPSSSSRPCAALFLYLHQVTAARIVMRMTTDIQKAAFAHLINADYARLTRETTGPSGVAADQRPDLHPAGRAGVDDRLRQGRPLGDRLRRRHALPRLDADPRSCSPSIRWRCLPVGSVGRRLRSVARRTQSRARRHDLAADGEARRRAPHQGVPARELRHRQRSTATSSRSSSCA